MLVCWTVSRPRSPVNALALPALVKIALARPEATTSRLQITGAAAVSERVKTPATVAVSLSVINNRSSRFLYFSPLAATARPRPSMAGKFGNLSGARGDRVVITHLVANLFIGWRSSRLRAHQQSFAIECPDWHVALRANGQAPALINYSPVARASTQGLVPALCLCRQL